MDTSSTPKPDGGLSEDRIFTLLSARRRRELLRVVDRLGGAATIGDVTDGIAAGEHGESASAGERKAVYVSLHQTHIPRLVESGVLVHDADERTVSLTEQGVLLLAYLQFDPTTREPGLVSRFLGRRKRPN